MVTQLVFEKFRPTKLQVPPNKPKFVEGFSFEFELGKKMVQELGSSIEGFRDPMTQTSTPKSMEEVVAKIMKVDKAVELF